MDLSLSSSEQAFRDELRQWLEANKPEGADDGEDELFLIPNRGGNGRIREWTDKLREGGWLCVSWPREYGGRGLTGLEVAVLNEEFARAGVPRVTLGMGESLVGPSIIVHGTDDQKTQFLPRIISGEDRYCQGFSEPDHGSDLAGLETRGTVDGDEIVIRQDAEGDLCGHGTACAGVVRSLAPDAEIHSVRVLGAGFKGSGRTLLAGLRWAIEGSTGAGVRVCILDSGVEIQYSSPVNSMKALLDSGFDAVFVGSGAPRGKDLDIPGRHDTDPAPTLRQRGGRALSGAQRPAHARHGDRAALERRAALLPRDESPLAELGQGALAVRARRLGAQLVPPWAVGTAR